VSAAAKTPAIDLVALAPVVDELCTGASGLSQFPGGRIVLPSRDAVIGIVEDLRSVLFPGYFGTSDLNDESLHYFVGATLARAMRTLEEQIRRGFAFTDRHDYETCDHCADLAQKATKAFLAKVPAIRRLVRSDVEAAYEGDPALKSRDEAIFAYPGVFAVTNQRIAHELHVLGVPLINAESGFNFTKSVVYAIGSGAGFALAIILMASLREKLQYADVPKSLQGLGIAFILAGMLALSFFGFSGMIPL
jgi:serine O-acetyltransferase